MNGRTLAVVFVLAGVLLLAGNAWRNPAVTGPAEWPHHPLGELLQEQGLAFRAPLPPGAPSADGGSVTAALLEDGKPIGEAAEHDAIRTLGRGRHSFWNGTLYFTTSDNSDPRQNGRRYEVAWPEPQVTWPGTAAWSAGWLVASFAVAAGARAAVRRLQPDRRRRQRLWFKLLLALVSTLFCLGAVELAMRWRYPFADSNWPGAFDPGIGFHFAPNTEIRRTNLFDYCTRQTTNSLGFADREPAALAAGERRVLVLGDSFVEAVQVPMAQKFHVRLAERLRAHGTAVATVALGMSGSGTSTELAFYRHIGRRFAPRLVVLVVVNNDFANNSALLEALRYGWDPAHTPRPYFVPDGDGARWQEVDAGWSDFAAPTPPTAPASLLGSCLGWSRTYRWIESTVDVIGGASQKAVTETLLASIARLDPHGDLRASLGGWQPPEDLDIDAMVTARDAPPAFASAIAMTERSLRALRDEVAADGASLLVVLAENLSEPPTRNPLGRALVDGAYRGLAESICARLGLATIDLHAAFAAAGVLDHVTFVRDHHWNAVGHDQAAIATADYLTAHPELLGR